MSEDRYEPVVIVGRDPRREVQIRRAMAAVNGLGAWLIGPSSHYAHTLHPPRRQARLPEPVAALPPPPAQDTRDDKYLHAAARRRRRASLQSKDTPDV